MEQGGSEVVGRIVNLTTGRAEPLQRETCGRCGRRLTGKRLSWCSDICRVEARMAQHLRQAVLRLDPPAAPVPPVVDQRVPRGEARKLTRMSRTILELLERGRPVLASDIHNLFHGARSVRTRISDVGLWLPSTGRLLRSEPVKGIVGEWRYWIEEAE